MEPKLTDSEHIPMFMVDGKLELETRENRKKVSSPDDVYYIEVLRPGLSFNGIEGPTNVGMYMEVLTCDPKDVQVGSINRGNPGSNWHRVSEIQGVSQEQLGKLVSNALSERYGDVNGALARVVSERATVASTTASRFRNLAKQGVVYFSPHPEPKEPPSLE